MLTDTILRVNKVALLSGLLLAYNANAVTENSILERIQKLEQRITILESANHNWKDPILWSRLKKEMSMSDVKKILGPPSRIEESIFTTWYYHATSKGHSFVWFDNKQALGWKGYQN